MNHMDNRNQLCPIDSGKMVPYFSERIMGKYDVQYYVCEDCSLIQTETPYWLDEAYSRALSVRDTGIMERNLHNALRATATIWLLAGKRANVVDVAGGYGLLVRMLRDIGFHCVWDDKYCDNLMATGFECPDGFTADVACAFEVFEHVADPCAFFAEIAARFQCRYLIFSTEEFVTPPDRIWNYFAFGTGQHITFYSRESIARMASLAGWCYYALPRHLHLFAKTPPPRWKTVLLKSPLIYPLGALTLLVLRRQSKTRLDHDTVSGV
jgi:hypothetical protein